MQLTDHHRNTRTLRWKAGICTGRIPLAAAKDSPAQSSSQHPAPLTLHARREGNLMSTAQTATSEYAVFNPATGKVEKEFK
ncbi:hypothetical protein GCM10023259_103910 [Thermocatellispora tengchongensis]